MTDELHSLPASLMRRVDYIFLSSFSQSCENRKCNIFEVGLWLTVHVLEQEIENIGGLFKANDLVTVLRPRGVLRVRKYVGMYFEMYTVDFEDHAVR